MLRPQMNDSRMTVDLGGIWEVELKGESKPIAVPASWNEQYQELFYEEGPVYYRREFNIPRWIKAGRIRLYFGAVNTDCEVYINGRKVGENHIGYLPFEVDISDSVKIGKNELVVKVTNRLKTGGFPSRIPEEGQWFLGSFPPAKFDFIPYGGIIRPVTLEFSSGARVEDIWVKTNKSIPEKGRGVVEITINVSDEAVGKEMRIELAGRGKTLQAEKIQEISFEIDGARFWSTRDPYLYDLRVRIGEDDEYQLKVGIRTIEWDDKNLYLNGEPIFLKGFGKHEEFPILGQGTFYPLMVKDLKLLKWIGANSFRTSHYPYSEEWLDLADETGILVIDEAPHVGITRYHYNPETQEQAVRNVKRMIDRDKNHPSVIMWSLANEPESNCPEAEEFFKALYEGAKSMDETRPVTFVSAKDRLDESTRDFAMKFFDIISVNRYYGWYDFQGRIDEGLKALEEDLDLLYKRHKKPVFVTEFGADAIAGLHYDPPQMFSEEYQAEIIKRTINVLKKKEYIIGTHVWAFADFKTLQNVLRPILNHKGVFTRTRNPKLAAHILRELWTNES